MMVCIFYAIVLSMVTPCKAFHLPISPRLSHHILSGSIEQPDSSPSSHNNDDDKPLVGEESNMLMDPSPPIMSMEALLSPPSNCDVTQMGPTAMAYIGDVVFELFVRSRMVWPTRRTSDLQQQVVSLVRAEHQAKLLSAVVANFELTQKEEQIIVRGRNSGSVKGNRRKTPAYNDATALETLIGYLYIVDKERCTELMNFLYINLLDR